jgi:hypothetical protein
MNSGHFVIPTAHNCVTRLVHRVMFKKMLEMLIYSLQE